MRSIFRFFAAVLVFAVCLPLYAGLYSKPHKMYVLKVANFSIIFPEQSSYTARLIGEHCEAFFAEAAEKTGLEESFKIPVVITPDSSEISASYSQQPYNRIVVCDALSDKSAAYREDLLLDLFRQAVIEAAAYTVRSKNWRMVHTLTGVDLFQPIYLLNVTSAFVDGAACAWDDSETAAVSDTIAMEYLVQAKAAKKFPTWQQVSGVSDSYLYSAVEKAVCSAFSAYVMQRWGVDAFAEYWRECGRVHFFALMPGIFRKVYGVPLSRAWQDFENAIEIPPEMYCDTVVKSTAEKIINRTDFHFASPVKSAKGVIWYDEVRQEVSILYDRTKKRKTLFSASGVTRLCISTDRKYLAVSAHRTKSEEKLSEPYTRVFDIEKKRFLKGVYPISDACIVTLPYHKYAVAGVSSVGQNSELRMYLVNDSNTDDVLLTRRFATGSVAHQFASAGKNTLLCLVNEDGVRKLLSIELPSGIEHCYEMPFPLLSLQGADGVLTFSYLSADGGFTKMGYLNISLDGTVSRCSLVEDGADGNIAEPFLSGSDFVYAVHRAAYDELFRLKRAYVPYRSVQITSAEQVKAFSESDSPVIEKRVIQSDEDGGKIKTGLFMDEWKISRYNPLKFMARKLIYFFFPITALDLEDDYKMTVGAGFSYFTNEDALENSQLILSYSAAAVDPEDDYLGVTGDNIFTAIYNNSILPVKISLGGNWAMKENGQYTLTTLGGVSYRLPVGFEYQNLTFSVQDMWTASTFHKDRYTKKEEQKEGWINPSEAFTDNAIRTGVSYSTYRQSGLTAFEQLGFEIKQYFLYDVDFSQDKQENDKTIIDVFDSDRYERSSLSFSYGVKVPRLLPFETHHFVWTLPTYASVSLYGESGTALSWFAETLLAGYEVQQGIAGANVYVHRLGITGGYHGDFQYDTLVVPGPDFAAIKEFATVFAESELNHYVYLTGSAVLSPIAGFLTEVQISADCQLRYYLRDNHFDTAFKLKTNL